MAQVFCFSPTDARWLLSPLEAGCYSVAAEELRVVLRAAEPVAPWPALLLRPSATGKPQWLCLAISEAFAPRVNGDPVVGCRVLAHRDVIEIGGERIVFSAETPARVEAFAGAGGAAEVRCPRCLRPLVAGELMVRCPDCGTMHHATTDSPCWSYGPKCAVCSRATALDAAPSWTPEEL